RYYFQTFGNFEMLVDDKIVHFQSKKAKELMALCVYEEGKPVSIHRILEYLWGDDATSVPAKTGYRRVIKDLSDSLKACGAEEILSREYGSIRVNLDLCDSDYINFMNGDPRALCLFQGSYMAQYSWAEDMVYKIQERKNIFMRSLK
ncbi:MAG: response regulator, partial [Lachnospiraceae bacterium]|nr:response regulator [Candidatus Equihabitans merdae]